MARADHDSGMDCESRMDSESELELSAFSSCEAIASELAHILAGVGPIGRLWVDPTARTEKVAKL